MHLLAVLSSCQENGRFTWRICWADKENEHLLGGWQPRKYLLSVYHPCFHFNIYSTYKYLNDCVFLGSTTYMAHKFVELTFLEQDSNLEDK